MISRAIAQSIPNPLHASFVPVVKTLKSFQGSEVSILQVTGWGVAYKFDGGNGVLLSANALRKLEIQGRVEKHAPAIANRLIMIRAATIDSLLIRAV